MANDGLLFRCLGNVNHFTHTPILSTLLFGTLTAILALFISMETLVEFLSVGTLFIYSVVAANLIILRYSPDERFKVKSTIINTQSSEIEKLSIQKGFQYSSVDPVEMVLHVEKPSKTTGKDEASFYENGYDQRSENSPRRNVCEDVSEKLHRECHFDQTDAGIHSNKKDVIDTLTCEYNCDEQDEEKRSRNGRSHEAEDEICRKRDIGVTGKEITSPEKSVKNIIYPCQETPNCSHSLSQDTERTPIISKTDGFRSIGGLKPSFQRVPLLKDLSPGRGVAISVGCLIPLLLGLALALIVGADLVGEGVWWMVVVIVLLVVFAVFFVLVIVAHEQNVMFSTFQMPLVPYLPLLSILINLMLMMSLSAITWLRLLVWVALGFVVYFSYGLHHSRENENSCHGPTPSIQMQQNCDNQETTTAISAPNTKKDCKD